MVEATKRLRDFTAALVFVAVCSAVVSFFQWREMKSTGGQTEKLITANQTLADAAKQQAQASIDNVKIARDSMTASQRAWVGPINARLKGELKVGAPIAIIAQYQNTGKEPATNFLSTAIIRVFSKSQDDSGEITEVISLTHLPASIWKGQMNPKSFFQPPDSLLMILLNFSMQNLLTTWS